MSEQGYYWEESLLEIIDELETLTTPIPPHRWEEIAKDLDTHVEMAREFMPPVPSSRDLADYGHRDEINELKRRVAELESKLSIYNEDIIRVKGGKYTTTDPWSRRVIIHD